MTSVLRPSRPVQSAVHFRAACCFTLLQPPGPRRHLNRLDQLAMRALGKVPGFYSLRAAPVDCSLKYSKNAAQGRKSEARWLRQR